MSLLNKFGSVKLNTSSRIPSNMIDPLVKLQSEYDDLIENLKCGLKYMNDFTPPKTIDNTRCIDFNRYKIECCDNLVLTHQRHYTNIVEMFNKLYHTEIPTNSYMIGVKNIFKDFQHIFYNHRKDISLERFDIIMNLRLDYNDIMSYIFDLTGNENLEELRINESKAHIKEMYLDSYRKYKVAKNGSIIFNSMATTSRYRTEITDESIKHLNALSDIINDFFSIRGMLVNIELCKAIGFTNSYVSDNELNYTKQEFEHLEYIKYNTNNSLKIKFNNGTLANEFIKYIGLW